MGGFQLFKDKLNDEKIGLLLKINILITVVILLISLVSGKKQLFLSESEGLTKEASKRDFCSLITSQLIEKKLSRKIITESLFSLVTADSYKALYFEGDEKISGIWSGDKSCKVLVKTKNGLRSFDYFFDQSMDFKYFYQVKKISENELFDKEGV